MKNIDSVPDIAELCKKITNCPYSIELRIKLARAYQHTGYPDLAAGESYIALLLIDEALGETGEFEDEAYEAAVQYFQAECGQEAQCLDQDAKGDDSSEDDERNKSVIAWVSGPIKDSVYASLAESLIECNNLKQASDYIKKISPAFAPTASQLHESLSRAVKAHFGDENTSHAPEEYPEWGLVRREIYPWNEHEPDRSSQDSLTSLNELLAAAAPSLEARITELPDLTRSVPGTGTIKQIGLFAKQDLPAGQQILREKSILTATARLNDEYCDACAAKLRGRDDGSGPVSCPECYETVFCSNDCLQLSRNSYHPVLCGKDVTSLAKDAPAKDAANSLYALLLLRTFALAEHLDLHPLDLVQTKYLWGDFVSTKPSLPFNLYYNVILPLTMLEKMEINIFTASSRFNTWTFNTLYAKFRGTADAKQGPDGKPEIGAVHPLWCLANHSCDPNVRWEWNGEMGFWTRTKRERVKWRVGDEEVKEGLRKDEEVLGHYCDVELTARERREWAKGALGGDCMCERCVWETEHPELARRVRIER
ncbi:uncharacterized protein PV09_06014 [Verruconis gallopava]|uniref:SET domain-containing protein n=1 Tax=Verruconis gallopava TaxID=253628 RepID=A0A0D2ATW6_9PEZI|nr:uncharacterized protein PV09_06014 [Verruconis gallopava]KIW02559.1 hypothetical protein PV09_06014 [Verruconis gallopava]